MRDIRVHYKRTLGLMNFLNIDETNAIVELSLKDALAAEDEMMNLVSKRESLKQSGWEALLEIYAIEKEKKTLRNSMNDLRNIFEWEYTVYRSRERFLLQEVTNFGDTIFEISPYVTSYESFWNWNIGLEEDTSVYYQEILRIGKGDYFFALQQTGSYDYPSDSNILELPLTEYQYFLLSIFEQPVLLFSAITAFEKEFSVTNAEEQEQLRQNTLLLIKELVYKALIVPCNRH